jgi:hypothetical protein
MIANDTKMKFKVDAYLHSRTMILNEILKGHLLESIDATNMRSFTENLREKQSIHQNGNANASYNLRFEERGTDLHAFEERGTDLHGREN